ncbi:MAG: carbohydrate kinase [Oscillospiraceae bacterium]|nr:carbohydrate kinase [Oscillospiraceae bacterium]
MSGKKYNVVALGELLIDFTENGLSGNGNPIFEANPGGAPCNVLAMLERLGKRTAFIGKVGNDSFGKMLCDTIKSCGIGAEGLVFDKSVPTTLAFVHKTPDGDREFSFYRNLGADMMLTKEEVNADIIRNSEIFHFGTISMTHSSNKEATVYAVNTAKENGLLVSFDPNLRKPLWESLSDARAAMEYGFSVCDILKISDDEIEFITGENDIDKGIAAIYGKYNIPLIFATMGRSGSRAYCGNVTAECSAYENKNVLDTTGAGDTFMGCALSFICENGVHMDDVQLKNLLDFSNAAASIITGRKGALKVMPKFDEIRGLQSSRIL